MSRRIATIQQVSTELCSTAKKYKNVHKRNVTTMMNVEDLLAIDPFLNYALEHSALLEHCFVQAFSFKSVAAVMLATLRWKKKALKKKLSSPRKANPFHLA
jgi:hypothetical protein